MMPLYTKIVCKIKNIINKLFREKYKDSLREIVSEPDVIKFKIVKKELNDTITKVEPPKRRGKSRACQSRKKTC
jgi:hypothetical protein